MKKTLLMMFALLCTMGTFAAEKGEYIYSHTAKYKVVGDNVVTNGNFSVGDGSEGWKNDLGSAMGANWKVVTNAGPNGENAIESQSASTAEGDALCNSWELTAGLYSISYYVYSAENATSSITAGSTNYVNFTAGEPDAETPRAIAASESWKGGQWTQIVDTIFVNTDKEVLSFNANNVAEGIKFTGFEIHQVMEVYDSRIIDRLIEYAEKLLLEPDLANGRDEFAGIMEMMKEAIADPASIEDKDAAQALIDAFNGAFDEFMNENGGNTVGTTGDWTQIPGSGFKGLTTFGAWKFEGGRWGFSANDERNGRPVDDGYVATAGIQKGWAQHWPAYIESAALEPGHKYFFSIEAQAVAASTTQISDNPPYGADHNTPIVGGENYKMFIGTDTLSLEGDTISGYYWKRYYMIAEIPADADAVRAGWIFDFPSTMGERASLRNPEFRLIGKSEIQINYEAAVKDVIIQQKELGNRLVNYPLDVASYNWEKDSLTRAIDHAEPIYDASFEVVANDGGCVLAVNQESVDQLKELYQSLLGEVNALGRAKNYIIAQNAIFANMESAIAAAKNVLADDLYQDGDKATFQAAINAAQAVLDNMSANSTDATREADEPAMQAAIDTLNEAVEVFKASAHLVPVVDIDFSNAFTVVSGEEEDNDALRTYMLKGAAGQMDFTEGAVDTDNSTGAIKYMLGWKKDADTDAVLLDVLRVGPTEATVEIPAVGDDEVLRVCFDAWFGKLTKKFASFELRNDANERVAGFNYNSYENSSEYNDFNNAENTGMNPSAYATGVGSSSASNDAICVDNNRTSFELIVDYKTQTMKGIINNPQKGTNNGVAIALPAIENAKVTRFVLASTYNNADRRCWFDNLKVYKYKSSGSLDGIDTVNANVKAANNGVYTISGVQVANSKNLPAGLYIINGKKVVVK